LIGNELACKEQYDGMFLNLENSSYWKERFDQFGLNVLVENFPDTAELVPVLLDSLRTETFDQIKIFIPKNVEQFI